MVEIGPVVLEKKVKSLQTDSKADRQTKTTDNWQYEKLTLTFSLDGLIRIKISLLRKAWYSIYVN